MTLPPLSGNGPGSGAAAEPVPDAECPPKGLSIPASHATYFHAKVRSIRQYRRLECFKVGDAAWFDAMQSQMDLEAGSASHPGAMDISGTSSTSHACENRFNHDGMVCSSPVHDDREATTHAAHGAMCHSHSQARMELVNRTTAAVVVRLSSLRQ